MSPKDDAVSLVLLFLKIIAYDVAHPYALAYQQNAENTFTYIHALADEVHPKDRNIGKIANNASNRVDHAEDIYAVKKNGDDGSSP